MAFGARTGHVRRSGRVARGPGLGKHGVLLVLESGDVIREAMAAGWVVVNTRRHLDARHGKELFWVASQRPEVLQRALLHVARLKGALPR